MSLKKTIVILVLAVFVFQSISSFLILASFTINRDYISSTKCVNRFDKISVCKGQCYLAKELKENDETQEQLPNIKHKGVNPFTLSDSFTEFISYHSLPIQTKLPFSQGSVLSGYTTSVDHPPTLV